MHSIDELAIYFSSWLNFFKFYAAIGWDYISYFAVIAWKNLGDLASFSYSSVLPVLKKLEAANWIAVSAAVISVLSVVQNNRSASQRDRLKNKREEFNKQIGTPIENALSEFQNLSDKFRDLADTQTNDHAQLVDGLLAEASRAQRKLSRAIKKASSSQLCSNRDWSNLASNSYDGLIESIEGMRLASKYDAGQYLVSSSDNIETIIEKVNQRIYIEIKRYI